MKRGIFRIIAGSIMVLLQLLSMMALTSAGVDYTSSDVGYNIGFYSIGVVGIVLLIFGINAYKKGLRSHLVLHTRSTKFHTVIKWVMFVITTLLFVCYLVNFIQHFDSFNIDTLLIIFATLPFAVYLLFYIYKKPCCLPSTSLIFLGIAYLYDVLDNMNYYLFYILEFNSGMLILIIIISELVAGILYFILASKLYKENFSVKAVKVIAWIAFAMEISYCVVYPIFVSITFGSVFYFYDLVRLLYNIFILGFLLYICAFKINTLKKQAVEETTDIVRFCRKCGNELLNDSQFCNKCDAAVINENLKMDNLHMNRSLGTKWFTFYTKVRPWLACITALSVVSDFLQYVEVYTSYWWMMLYFATSVTEAILAVMVFAKSREDYINFVRFVKKVLLFETISIVYSHGVQQYIYNGFEFGVAFISAFIAALIAYFVWYRLNMKYFNKRIMPVEYVADTYAQATYTTENIARESNKTSFCRKCGNKLLDDARFCSKCGTEVIEELGGNNNDL